MNTVPVSATYNRQCLLEPALRSVFAQTAQPQEVIVVDDGSNDLTRTLLQTTYPDIKYHYHENQGVSRARNAGIALARSPWIALLDSDDEWLPEKLQRQFEALRSNSGYLLRHPEEI